MTGRHPTNKLERKKIAEKKEQPPKRWRHLDAEALLEWEAKVKAL